MDIGRELGGFFFWMILICKDDFGLSCSWVIFVIRRMGRDKVRLRMKLLWKKLGVEVDIEFK